jgi:hypothetical protein
MQTLFPSPYQEAEAPGGSYPSMFVWLIVANVCWGELVSESNRPNILAVASHGLTVCI